MKKILTNYWPLLCVALAIGFNLILLFPETTIKMDLNDNVFAYTLIREMNNMVGNFLAYPSWSNFGQIFDHQISEWAMGYPLPHFYQHIPHLTVVLLYRFISSLDFARDRLLASLVPRSLGEGGSLLAVFNWLKYLMLSFFPLVIYYSARKFEFSKIAASGSALVSTLISTNYLYGTDYNALVFRGSGMYTQLWGIFFLPLALSCIYDSLKYGRGYIKAVIFLALALAGHLVFGYIAVLSTPLLVISLAVSNLSLRGVSEMNDVAISKKPAVIPDLIGNLYNNYHIDSRFRGNDKRVNSLAMTIRRLFLILSSSFLLLSYWLIPLILNSNYQNKSVWDDFTKFNSYGWQQILKWLVNGEIFDYGRLPVLTILVAMGFFYALYSFANNYHCHSRSSRESINNYYIDSRFRGNDSKAIYLFFPLLFLFWLILYFGRFTWGSLFDLLPMSEGLHNHRLVNGVHLAGIFLIGLAIEWIFNFIICHCEAAEGGRGNLINRLLRRFAPRNDKIDGVKIFLFVTTIFLILFPAFKERFDYLSWNNYLIRYYNSEFAKEWPDFKKVLDKIESLGKGRINLGRPGNWGRNFTVGGFSAYFVASENGFDTIGFLPESWSPHSDIEQFFNEEDPEYYKLFNIRYIIAPPDKKFGLPVDSASVATSAKEAVLTKAGKFVLYKVNTEGSLSFINSDILVYAKKTQKINLDRFWIDSKLMPQKEHPTVVFYNDYSNYKNYNDYKLVLTMTDWSNYKLGQPNSNNGDYNLFNTNPFDQTTNNLITNFSISTPSGQVLWEKSSKNFFSAAVDTPKASTLLLRATYHPFWQAFIDGQKVNKFMVEPAMMAIRVPQGKHLVEFKYYPAVYKQILILVSLLTLPVLYFFFIRKR